MELFARTSCDLDRNNVVNMAVLNRSVDAETDQMIFGYRRLEGV